MISALEIKRQIIHISLGLIILLLVYFNILYGKTLLFFSALALILSYILKRGYKIPFFELILKNLQRKSEKEKMPLKGLIFYLLGTGLSVIFYTKQIALASIVILAFGDSVSRLVGPYGYLKHPLNSNKFIEGVIAGSIAATLAASFFVPFIYALIASSCAMALEGLDLEINNLKVDDNLTIPLVAGIVLTILL